MLIGSVTVVFVLSVIASRCGRHRWYFIPARKLVCHEQKSYTTIRLRKIFKCFCKFYRTIYDRLIHTARGEFLE